MLKTLRDHLGGMHFKIVVIIVLIVISVTGVLLLRTELLKSAQDTGTALARVNAVEEENNITVYRTLISLGTQYIDDRVREGSETEELTDWLETYFHNMTQILGAEKIDPYAVVDGKIIAANPWEGDAGYDAVNTPWYQKAIEKDGEIVFTDAYEDVISGRQVVTISQKCRNSDSVFAFDIFPENFHLSGGSQELPEDGSYFLCDATGSLLYAQTNLKTTDEKMRGYVRKLMENVKDGSLRAYDSYIYDLEGDKRGVYFDRLDNGWYSIITIPFQTILNDLNKITAGISILLVLVIAYMIFINWRDYRSRRSTQRSDETVRALGNTYYAMYLVNYKDGTYEMIKGSEYVRERLSRTGAYEDLLAVMKELIEENAYEEFVTSFSLQSMKNLVDRRIRDFGGDFLRRFGEEYRWVNIRLLYDDSISNKEVIMSFREVEAEKREQLQQRRLLENALASARKSEKSKNSFFSNMSHDMRTPLNAIIGFTELAQKTPEDAQKLCEYMGKINASSKQLLNLNNDILEMSRMEQGKFSMDYSSFNLKNCVEECCSLFKTQAENEEKEFSLTVDVNDSVVFGDAFRITQILNNLLSNAVKFTKKGDRISVKVKQMNYREHLKYQISVADTGAGMSEEFLEQIFEPYARETRFGAKDVSGTGLGMPIVKSLVTQMSGEITVKSRLGEGSAFIVTIPLEAAEKEQQEEPDREQKEIAGDVSLEGKRVLLAEDNEVNMEIAVELLSMNGIEVTQAWNGREAVEIFGQAKPFAFDAILMDMQMPELDGCGAARQIREMERPDAEEIPIIAVTANAFAEDIARATAAGIDAHISKPIDFPALYKTLAELIAKD